MGAVEAFILAGGRSSRMGSNKALLPLAGATVLARVIATATAVASRVRLVANDAPTYASYGLDVLPDRWPGAAALGGIGTAIFHAASQHVVVLACDMPFVTSAFLATLLSLAPEAEVVIPETAADGLHPLCAVYAKACLPAIEGSIAAERLKIVSFFAEVRVRRVDETEMRRLGHDPVQLANLNTPAEYERALQEFGQP